MKLEIEFRKSILNPPFCLRVDMALFCNFQAISKQDFDMDAVDVLEIKQKIPFIS